MSGRLLLLFLIVPAVEIALLVTVGDRVGFWPTLGLVVGAALAGSWLARREGRGAWRRIQTALAEGRAPAPEIVDGLVVLVAATLLVAPGFLPDAVGLLGLFPPTRALARRALVRGFARRVADGRIRVAVPGAGFGGPFSGPFGAASGGPADGGIEDAEVVDDRRRGPRAAGDPAPRVLPDREA